MCLAWPLLARGQAARHAVWVRGRFAPAKPPLPLHHLGVQAQLDLGLATRRKNIRLDKDSAGITTDKVAKKTAKATKLGSKTESELEMSGLSRLVTGASVTDKHLLR